MSDESKLNWQLPWKLERNSNESAYARIVDAGGNILLAHISTEIAEFIIKSVNGYQGIQRTLSEALNQGDGTYKP